MMGITDSISIKEVININRIYFIVATSSEIVKTPLHLTTQVTALKFLTSDSCE
jgi:hypothetical protein